ncbi:Slam-dependent surface lipoprotein, partial [Ursidibacter sp. B-7004-1]
TNSNLAPVYSGVYFFTGDGKNGNLNSASNLDSLEIDGKKLSLVLGNEIHKEKKLTDSTFGVYAARGLDEDYAISRGKITPDSQIPTTGKFNYKGDAFYGSQRLGGWVDGKSSFSVDFNNKTVDGNITVASHNVNIQLPTATISGSSFYGGSDRTSWVRGKFYGENAKELGGIYEDDVNGSAAVFGATKQ